MLAPPSNSTAAGRGHDVLYAYVEGSALAPIAPALELRLHALNAATPWVCPDAWVVNQRHVGPAGPDLPDWELGLNLALPTNWREHATWFSDVEDILVFILNLPGELARPFVLGIASAETGVADDICTFDPGNPNLKYVKGMFLGQ